MVTPAEKAVVTGGVISLQITVLPTNASHQSVTWNSSDPSIATVGADVSSEYPKP